MKSPAAKTRTTTMMVRTETVMATSPVCLLPVCGEERGRAVPLGTGKCDYDHTGTSASRYGWMAPANAGGIPRWLSKHAPLLRLYMVRPQLHFHRDRQAADAFANLLRLRMGKIQAHVAAAFVAVVGVETVSRNEGHVFRKSRS